MPTHAVTLSMVSGTICAMLISIFFFRAEDGIRYPLVTGVQTCALPIAVGGVRRLDERPAQVAGPVLAQAPAPVALARLLDPGTKAGVADQLAWAPEAGDVADLGGDREGEHPADPRTAHQQRDVPVLGAEPAQLLLAGGDPLVEQVDQLEAGGDRRGPGVGQLQPFEQRPAADTEQVAAR